MNSAAAGPSIVSNFINWSASASTARQIAARLNRLRVWMKSKLSHAEASSAEPHISVAKETAVWSSREWEYRAESGFVDSLRAAQHVLEMFRRNLPEGPDRRLLDRLANRLTKITAEAQTR